MKCLEVNDKLLAILSDSDEEAPAPSPAPTTTDDLLLSVEDTKAPASHHPPSNSMMSMQEDLAKVRHVTLTQGNYELYKSLKRRNVQSSSRLASS